MGVLQLLDADETTVMFEPSAPQPAALDLRSIEPDVMPIRAWA